MTKSYWRIGECVEGLKALEGERAAGIPTEYKTWGDNITYKPGFSCVLFSTPGSGKSYFVLHTLVKQAENNGKRSFIFSPEMGDKAEITALLVEIKSGKTIYDISGKERISGDELDKCLRWLNNYFIILDSERTMTIEQLYEQLEMCQEELGIKIDFLCCDNLNDIAEPNYGSGRQDLNVEAMFTFIRAKNKKLNCYTFLVTHTASQGAPIIQDGISFYSPPTARQVRSGEAIYRKAYLLLTLWRPPYGLKDETGRPYEENETHVIVLKAKPANTAVKGFVGRLFFNWRDSKFTDQPPTIKAY